MALMQDINGMFDKERAQIKDADDKASKQAIDLKQMAFITASVEINSFLANSKDPDLQAVQTKVRQIAELCKKTK